METKPVVLLVGVYDSKADADTDHEDAKVLNRNGFLGSLTPPSSRKTTTARWPAGPAMVQIEAIMPLMGHASAPVPADPSAGNGHYRVAQVPLMMTGPLELRLSIDAPNGVDHLTVPLSVSG